MKDVSLRNIPKDTVYKDVVIIGNGPSGIALSYMLAGNWPYWNPDKIDKHPDELLRARLNYADSSKSLVMQDLVSLADGLEGRSTNPVSLLLDSLEHPCADLGMELPSMLEFKSHPNAQIDHIVLGKGPPGGSWHRMDPNLRTLSLAAWMSLPGLSFCDWETRQLKNELSGKEIKKQDDTSDALRRQAILGASCTRCIELRTKSHSRAIDSHTSVDLIENNNESESGALCCKCTKTFTNKSNRTKLDECDQSNIDATNSSTLQTVLNKKGQTVTTIVRTTAEGTSVPVKVPPRRNLSLKRQISKEVQTRALVSRVAEYYEDYVHQMNLDKYFMNDTIVTMIAPIHESCTLGKLKSAARWLVCGFKKSTGKVFYFACRALVLANGASDLANRLGLSGEDANISWVKHELPQLESALESLTEQERKGLKPVVIVGAGLSAADAVTICRSSDVSVVHVFRSRTAGLDKMLPENVYPEYHEVHKMMKDTNNVYDYYSPLPEHTIVDVTTTNGVHKVTVENLNTNERRTIEVSFCAILIGSRPDLRFASNVIKCPVKNQVETIYSIGEKMMNQQNENPSILSRKVSWLKSLCVKCKHLNLCDWGRRCEYRKVCAHGNNKNCDCVKAITFKESPSNTIEEQSGLGLGVDPTKPIDCKSNQIAVDKYTNEILRVPKGLYAMGPLVGDNFVRFIPGGALAITAALHKEND